MSIVFDRHLFRILFTGLLAILNPLAIIPYYLASKPLAANKQTAQDALIMAVACFLFLSIGGFAGVFILNVFGLELIYFRIAGASIIIYNAFRMVIGSSPAGHTKLHKKLSDIQSRGLIVPITMPMVSGPGSIAYLISKFGADPKERIMIAIAILFSSLLYYFIIRKSELLRDVLGEIGIDIISRIMGLILLGLGIQTIASIF